MYGDGEEHRFKVVPIDLGTARATPTEVYAADGGVLLSTTVCESDGTFYITFDDPTNDLKIVKPLPYPASMCFQFRHTKVYIQNAQQVGKAAELWIGRSK